MDDDIIERSIDIFRFAAGQRADVLRILKRMEEDLIELLMHSGKPLTAISRADKARLLRLAQAAISQYYGQASDAVGADLGELGRVEAAATVATLERAFQGAIAPSLPPETFFKRLVDETLIQGAPSAEWWERQEADIAFRFRSEVAQGLAQAETNAQIIARVRGQVMNAARNHVAALVQTSVQTVANVARMETFEENDDVIKGYKQLSTLDGHTSVTCVSYSGATWDKDKKPTGETRLPFVSPGGSASGTPRHFNCRSLITPITKTFRELGLDIPEFKETTRSSVDGQVGAATTFDGFLKRKGAAFTDDLLGPGRAELWRQKKLTLAQLLDQSGRPLTLAQLRAKYG